jgi:predicted nucleotide-binding protein
MDKLERIRISTSEEPSSQIIEALRYRDANSSVMVIGGPSMKSRAAGAAEDVTDQFISGPPGSDVPNTSASDISTTASSALVTGPGDKRSVFIVSGRDTEISSNLVQVLRALGLQIVEWEHAVAKTGLPNPYVGDVVTAGLTMADVAVVILTPDDIVKLRADLLHEEDDIVERTLHGQSRPNVIYEAGFADALGRDRTVIVEIGSSKPFSDISGRHTLRYDGSASKRNVLVQRLTVAGLQPDTSGNDWLKVGDISSAIDQAKTAIETERNSAGADLQ